MIKCHGARARKPERRARARRDVLEPGGGGGQLLLEEVEKTMGVGGGLTWAIYIVEILYMSKPPKTTGCQIKVQKVERPTNSSYYLNLPVVLAEALEITKGEEIVWLQYRQISMVGNDW